MDIHQAGAFRRAVTRAVVAACAAFVLLMPTPVAADGPSPIVFNARKDFQLAPNQSNPSGPWSYRIVEADGSRPLLSIFDASHSDVDGVEAWSTAEGNQAWPWTPAVWFNNTGGDYLYTPADRLFAHPSNEHPVVIRWKSPGAGHISIRLWLTDSDNGGGDGVGWSIGKVRHPALKGVVLNGGSVVAYVARINVQAGERIDLKIHARTDQGWDTTQVGLKISFWPS